MMHYNYNKVQYTRPSHRFNGETADAMERACMYVCIYIYTYVYIYIYIYRERERARKENNTCASCAFPADAEAGLLLFASAVACMICYVGLERTVPYSQQC